MFKFVEIALTTKVKNNQSYLQSMIYGSAFEMNTAITNDLKSKMGY